MLEYLKDDYEIVREIGHGGMAVVYLALDKTNGEKVAIKVVSSKNMNNPILRKRFISEINMMKKINSNNVIKIYDYKLEDDKQYIVMEYIEGVILKQYIRNYGSLSPKQVVDFTIQIASGLYAIHKANIIHRDIKNTNIIVSNNNEIKIIDFGIARDENSLELTQEGAIIGSPQYIAPEKVTQNIKGNAQTDIYALGIVMYEMLVGSLPFASGSVEQIVKSHINKSIPNITKLRPNIPQALSNIVLKATAKNPIFRYKTVFDMIKDLKTCLDNKRIYEKEIVFGNKEKPSFMKMVNSKWFWLIVSSVSILILAAVIVVVLVVH